MNIRPETESDHAAIHAVHVAAFPTDLESRLVTALRTTGQLSVSLVAIEEVRIVGHIALSPVSIEAQEIGLGLAPVAVIPEFQRRGIGTELIRAGLRAAAQMGVGWVVVLGHPEFYQRFGFQRASTVGLSNEYGVDEPFMVLELVPGGLTVKGLVRYAPAFALF